MTAMRKLVFVSLLVIAACKKKDADANQAAADMGQACADATLAVGKAMYLAAKAQNPAADELQATAMGASLMSACLSWEDAPTNCFKKAKTAGQVDICKGKLTKDQQTEFTKEVNAIDFGKPALPTEPTPPAAGSADGSGSATGSGSGS
jgi:hypothetical protein